LRAIVACAGLLRAYGPGGGAGGRGGRGGGGLGLGLGGVNSAPQFTHVLDAVLLVVVCTLHPLERLDGAQQCNAKVLVVAQRAVVVLMGRRELLVRQATP
jgi:hypothetical protein